MALSAVLLAVCASYFVASGVSSMENSGMDVYCTNECLAMWYKHAVFGDELRAKSKMAHLTSISGNVSTLMGPTFGYDLGNVTLKNYTAPEVQALITSANGIEMVVKVAEMSVEGNFKINYNINNWPLYYGAGNFSMLIRQTMIRMLLNTSFASDLESVQYKSFNRTCSIKDFDIVFTDPLSNCLLTLIDNKDLESLIEEQICELYKYVTEPIFSASYNFTPNITLNKEFLQQPIAHDGYIEARHKGVVVFNTAEKEDELKPLPAGRMEPMNPTRMKVYCMEESLFNSAASVIHEEKLLWDTYTTSDLPKGQESLLQMTSCGESVCFGNLFPNATNDHQKSTVELNVSTVEPPLIKITKDEFRVYLTLHTDVNARHENGNVALLFAFRQNLSAPIEIRMKDSNVYFKMQRPISNFEVVNSTIGQFNEDHLKSLAELSYLKVLYPTIERFCQVGFPLGVPYPFSATRSEVELRNGNVCLMYDFFEMNQ